MTLRVVCRWIVAMARPATSPNGPRILYTAAQVAARKASWARAAGAMLICTTIGGGVDHPLPLWPPYPNTPPMLLAPPIDQPPPPAVLLPSPVFMLPPAPRWRDTGELVHPQSVSEPPAGVVLAAALIGLAITRRRRT